MAKLVLELDLEPEVITKAENYAHNEHTDLSVIVGDFIKTIGIANDTAKNIVREPVVPYVVNEPLSDWVKSLTMISHSASEARKKATDPLLEKLKKMEVPESILSLTGILKGAYPDDMDYKEMKYEYLKEKYDL